MTYFQVLLPVDQTRCLTRPLPCILQASALLLHTWQHLSTHHCCFRRARPFQLLALGFPWQHVQCVLWPQAPHTPRAPLAPSTTHATRTPHAPVPQGLPNAPPARRRGDGRYTTSLKMQQRNATAAVTTHWARIAPHQDA